MSIDAAAENSTVQLTKVLNEAKIFIKPATTLRVVPASPESAIVHAA